MKRIVYHLCVTSMALLCGCGTRLTNSGAEALIKESRAFKLPKLAHIHNGESLNNWDYPVERVLEKLGLAAEENLYFRINETKLQREGAVNVNRRDWYLPIAIKQFVNVIGISRESTKAKVQYTWKWVPTRIGASFTPSGIHALESADAHSLFGGGKSRKDWTEEDRRLFDWNASYFSDIPSSLKRKEALIEETEVFTSSIECRLYDTGWRVDK
jgi:hypothetical protein